MPGILPEKSVDRGAWRATAHGVATSWTWLSVHAAAAVSRRQQSRLTALRLLVTRVTFFLINETKLETDFIAYKWVVLLLVHFHVRPPISDIDYFKDLHKLSIGMDCFTLVLYSKSDKSSHTWGTEKNAQVKAWLSNSSENFFSLILLPLPLKMLLPLRIFINKTSCCNLSSQTLSANSPLILCYWSVISYFPTLVMALG